MYYLNNVFQDVKNIDGIIEYYQYKFNYLKWQLYVFL